MALDHYVPQVHLRHFLSPKLANKQLYGIRKQDLHKFPCGTRDICRVEDGNTNQFLAEPRLVEEFLAQIEPEYNRALEDLRTEQVSSKTVFVIAGFAASVCACAPASMRINAPSMAKVVEATALVLDRNGQIPAAPATLDGKSLTELLSDGTIKMSIDQKFPQALGIAGVLRLANSFGNAKWLVFKNKYKGSSFFTSDFPVAVHALGQRFSRLVPLAPDLAIAIVADPNYRNKIDLAFQGNRRKVLEASFEEIRALNTSIVQSAEQTVFFRDDEPWIERFVAKNAQFKIEYVASNHDIPNGIMTFGETQIVSRKNSNSFRSD